MTGAGQWIFALAVKCSRDKNMCSIRSECESDLCLSLKGEKVTRQIVWRTNALSLGAGNHVKDEMFDGTSIVHGKNVPFSAECINMMQ